LIYHGQAFQIVISLAEVFIASSTERNVIIGCGNFMRFTIIYFSQAFSAVSIPKGVIIASETFIDQIRNACFAIGVTVSYIVKALETIRR